MLVNVSIKNAIEKALADENMSKPDIKNANAIVMSERSKRTGKYLVLKY